MNSRLSITKLLFLLAALAFSCRGPVKEAPKKGSPAGAIAWHNGDENYVAIDTMESVVTWRGSNTFGSHTGYVSISKGELLIENGQLAGGTVEVDMNTIEDEKHQNNSGLIMHLKDTDFFHVSKFPFSTIALTEVRSINAADKEIRGNLTIKGITQPVSFAAQVEVKDGIVKANGKLVIDRTKWDVRYNSGKFFDNLKDQAISDSIAFDIHIIAKK